MGNSIIGYNTCKITTNTKCIIIIQEKCDKNISIIKHSSKELKKAIASREKNKYQENHGGCPIRNNNCLSFASTCVHPRLFGGVRVAHYFKLFACVFYLYLFLIFFMFILRFQFPWLPVPVSLDCPFLIGFLLRLGSPPLGIRELWFSRLGLLLFFFWSQRPVGFPVIWF